MIKVGVLGARGRVMRLVEVVDDVLEDPAALGRVRDGQRGGRQVGVDAVLEVKGEPGVGEQVAVPVAAGRGAAEVPPAADVMEPDLDAAGTPGPGAGGGDVHGALPGGGRGVDVQGPPDGGDVSAFSH